MPEAVKLTVAHQGFQGLPFQDGIFAKVAEDLTIEHEKAPVDPSNESRLFDELCDEAGGIHDDLAEL